LHRNHTPRDVFEHSTKKTTPHLSKTEDTHETGGIDRRCGRGSPQQKERCLPHVAVQKGGGQIWGRTIKGGASLREGGEKKRQRSLQGNCYRELD